MPVLSNPVFTSKYSVIIKAACGMNGMTHNSKSNRDAVQYDTIVSASASASARFNSIADLIHVVGSVEHGTCYYVVLLRHSREPLDSLVLCTIVCRCSLDNEDCRRRCRRLHS